MNSNKKNNKHLTTKNETHNPKALPISAPEGLFISYVTHLALFVIFVRRPCQFNQKYNQAESQAKEDSIKCTSHVFKYQNVSREGRVWKYEHDLHLRQWHRNLNSKLNTLIARTPKFIHLHTWRFLQSRLTYSLEPPFPQKFEKSFLPQFEDFYTELMCERGVLGKPKAIAELAEYSAGNR